MGVIVFAVLPYSEFFKSMGQNSVVSEHVVVVSNMAQMEYLIENRRQCEDLPYGTEELQMLKFPRFQCCWQQRSSLLLVLIAL